MGEGRTCRRASGLVYHGNLNGRGINRVRAVSATTSAIFSGGVDCMAAHGANRVMQGPKGDVVISVCV